MTTPVSRPRLRLAAAFTATLLLVTSCWGADPSPPASSSAPSGSASSATGVAAAGELSVAWEVERFEVQAHMGVAEGLVLLPDLAAGNTKLAMLSWEDGRELWSVDIAKDLGGADLLESGPRMPAGQVAFWAHAPEVSPSLLVYDTAAGSLLARVEGREGNYLSVAESGAVYEMIHSPEGSGTVSISRAASAMDFAAKQWTIQEDEEATKWFWVREHDGVVDFCVDGQAGPLYHYACYASLHIADATPVAGDGQLYRSTWVGDTLVGLEQGGPLQAFDASGRELWRVDVPAGYPLGWGEHLLFFPDDGPPAVIALDPGTGRELWTSDREDGWMEPLIDRTPSPEDGPLVMVQAYPSVRTGVLDPATGDITLVDHGLTDFREAFPTVDGAVLIASGGPDSLTWTAVKPGQPGTLWTNVLSEYDAFWMFDRHLVAVRGDRIALLH